MEPGASSFGRRGLGRRSFRAGWAGRQTLNFEKGETQMKRLFEDKVALVTGGGSGIGRASALAFANAGAKVVVSGRRENEGYETIALTKKAGGQGLFVKADVSKEADVEMLVAET